MSFIIQSMAKIRVGVLRGGPSSEYEVSLKTGENVLKFLPEKYEGRDILITKDGKWHSDGIERRPDKILRLVDVVFNALHGEFGENGKIQSMLEIHKIPFTGSDSFSSALGMNKFLAKQKFSEAGIKTPRGFVISKNDDLGAVAYRVFNNFSPPWVLKPLNKGSSVGVKIVDKFDDLKEKILEVFSFGNLTADTDIFGERIIGTAPKILFEEYIRGREATCGVLENFRRVKHYALPVVEIIPPKTNTFFDYEAKYNGETREICPANFDLKTKRQIEEIAKKAHIVLGCRAYSRSDFIVSRRRIFLLETNNLPGLTSESLLPKSAAAIGLNFSDLLEHLIKSCLKTLA